KAAADSFLVVKIYSKKTQEEHDADKKNPRRGSADVGSVAVRPSDGRVSRTSDTHGDTVRRGRPGRYGGPRVRHAAGQGTGTARRGGQSGRWSWCAGIEPSA